MFGRSFSISTRKADSLLHVSADFHQSPLSEKDHLKQPVSPQTCFTIIEYYYNLIAVNLQYVFHLFSNLSQAERLKKAIYRKIGGLTLYERAKSGIP